MNPDSGIDESKCPLCGDDNACGNIHCDAQSDKPCWCAAVNFPQQLFNQLPVELKNKACICQACVSSLKK